MSNPIGLLEGAVPPWVSVVYRSDWFLRVIAQGKHKSGEPLREYHIDINGGRSHLFARETLGRSILPENCIQRHMNTDGSFCIGYEAPSSVTDLPSAQRWWELLLGYLRCQDIADLTRRWPPNRGLSHGDAAAIQLKAEVIADQLGLLVQYRESVEYGRPWPPSEQPDSAEFLELVELETRRRQTDRDFLAYVHYRCCGTMEDCPIAGRVK